MLIVNPWSNVTLVFMNICLQLTKTIGNSQKLIASRTHIVSSLESSYSLNTWARAGWGTTEVGLISQALCKHANTPITMPPGVLYRSVNTILHFTSPATKPAYHLSCMPSGGSITYIYSIHTHMTYHLLGCSIHSSNQQRPLVHENPSAAEPWVALRPVTCAGPKILINHEPWLSDWFLKNRIVSHRA